MENKKVQSHDDYSVTRVPAEGKLSMWKITVLRLGGISCLPMLMLGSALGFGMTFSDAMWAIVLGSVILQVVGWLLGTIGAREGLTTSLITRWAGFGKFGSSLVGLITAVVCIGWFGIQNGVFASGIFQITGTLNLPVWSIICGVAVTFICIYGIKIMNVTAYIALPLFFVGVLWAMVAMLSSHDVGVLASEASPGPQIPFLSAIVMVAGAYMMGAIVTPDYSRFLKTGKQVFWMVLISTFAGELSMGAIGALLGHAAKAGDVTTVLLTTVGAFGVFLVIFSTIKINDVNLYSGSLGINNFFNLVAGVKWNRALVTLVVGLLGTILSVFGILNFFIDYLTILGIYLPPVAAIIIFDYFILKRNRKMLDEAKGALPSKVEFFNPMAIIAWIAGGLIGQFITWGIPSVNSLLSAGIIYLVLIKIFEAARKGNAMFKLSEKDVVQ